MTVLQKTQFISRTEITPSHARRSPKLVTSEAFFHIKPHQFVTSSSDSGNEQNQTFTQSVSIDRCETWLDRTKLGLKTSKNLIRKLTAPDETNVTVPSDDTLKFLANFIETDILSDMGLLRDKYLFEQINEKKTGWIRIRFISSLRRVKQKCKDWRVVAIALAHLQGSEIEVSECGFKVRRLSPIGECVYQKHANNQKEKTKIIVIKVPHQALLDGGFIKHLVSCKDNNVEPTGIEVIFPGEPMSKYLNSYAVHIPDIGKTICAAVEYDSEESARQAVKHINGRYTTMRSAVLGNKVKRILYNPKTIAEDYRIFLGEKPGFSICCQDSLNQQVPRQ